MSTSLQSLCDLGQRQLIETDYLSAETTLLLAEALALESDDFDSLARLYMPLQEARRQIRQRCGEGTILLDALATSPTDQLDAAAFIDRYPHGQFLLAGWASLAPAVELRRLQRERNTFGEAFLAAVYPIADARVVAIVPTEYVAMPPIEAATSVDRLIARLPPHSVVLSIDDLPKGERKGTWQTFAETMAIWERLHLPWLAAADATHDPRQRIEAYRKTIEIDSACELAHQRLSNTAHAIARSARNG